WLSRERGAPAPRHQRSLGSFVFVPAATARPPPGEQTRGVRCFGRRRDVTQPPLYNPQLEGRGEGTMKDEELEETEDFEDADDEEEAEGDEPEGSEAPSDGKGDGEVESSLDELIAKKEDRKPEEEAEEEETVLTPEREERLEPLSVKVVPP